MRKTGLIGRTLVHSLSPQIHHKFYELTGIPGTYELFETSKHMLGDLLSRMSKQQMNGVNVTIPYKTDVIQYMNMVTDEAMAIGAVNTIKFDSGSMIGYNTDYFGLKTLLETNGIALADKTIAVLGTGGAARCAVTLARDEGAKQVLAVSRHPENADEDLGAVSYNALNDLASIGVLINATPVGMHPDTDACPVSDNVIAKCEAVADMVYNPAKTLLLQKAQSRGIKAVNGLLMLVAQAIKAQEIWTNRTFAEHLYHDVQTYVHGHLYAHKPNIVLIGMPGCGKSSIGRQLAERMHMQFADTDDMIEQAHGSIPTIFEHEGEEAFRRYEHVMAKRTAALSGSVIATGGGMVLSDRSMQALNETGTIVYINRPLRRLLDDVDTTSRPLLSEGRHKLIELFSARSPLYNQYAEITVENIVDVDTCVADIITRIKEYER